MENIHIVPIIALVVALVCTIGVMVVIGIALVEKRIEAKRKYEESLRQQQLQEETRRAA